MLGGMQTKKPKRPRDPNQLGRMIVALSVGEIEEAPMLPDGKNAAAVALGRSGGKARAAALSSKKRREIAKKAASSRWNK